MDEHLRQSMRRYYDERAADYEEAYVRGLGTSSIADPDLFRREAVTLGAVVERVVHGRVVDLACGTAFWLPRYAARASRITLVDQSAPMLAESRAKVRALGLDERCAVREGDVLQVPLEAHRYDSALIGFLLSHLTDDEMTSLFARLRQALTPAGVFLILDSAWSPERAAVNQKVERQLRHLNDGTAFEIHKRYFDAADIGGWARAHGFRATTEYFGSAFFAITGTFVTNPVGD